MSAISEEDYKLILEPEFITFNKIRTVLCRNSPCTRGKRCTFAHNKEELRKSICLYNFNNGCNKAANVCQHSHDDKDLEKSISDYKKWKNPSPKPETKRLSDEELIKQFGEFKISLESESDSESEEDPEDDESDKQMKRLVKTLARTPYEVVQSNGEVMQYPEEFKHISGISPLVPPETINPEVDTQSTSSDNKSTSGGFSDNKLSEKAPSGSALPIYNSKYSGGVNDNIIKLDETNIMTLIYQQQLCIMNMMTEFEDVKNRMQKLENLLANLVNELP